MCKVHVNDARTCCIAGAGKKGDAMLHPVLPSNPIRSPARLAGSAAIKQLEPKPATAAAAGPRGSIEVDVNVQQLAGAVPQDFLGISLEWPGIEYYAGKGNAAAWSNVLGVLGPGAIIRVGGASQDKLTEVRHAPTTCTAKIYAVRQCTAVQRHSEGRLPGGVHEQLHDAQ
jgi:hypothetical protein